jgi:hypothetical protein
MTRSALGVQGQVARRVSVDVSKNGFSPVDTGRESSCFTHVPDWGTGGVGS